MRQMVNETKAKEARGRKKEYGEWDNSGVRTRQMTTYARIDLSRKESREKDPENFEKIVYTEPNYKSVDAAQKAVGKNLLTVLNAGVAAQAAKNAKSIVGAARNMSKITGGTIQEEMAVIKQRLATRK